MCLYGISAKPLYTHTHACNQFYASFSNMPVLFYFILLACFALKAISQLHIRNIAAVSRPHFRTMVINLWSIYFGFINMFVMSLLRINNLNPGTPVCLMTVC